MDEQARAELADSCAARALDVTGLRRLLAEVRSEPPIPLTAFRLEVEGGVVVRLVEVRPV